MKRSIRLIKESCICVWLWWFVCCSSVDRCCGADPVEDVLLEVRQFTPSLLPGNDVREILYASTAKFGPSLETVEGRMTVPPSNNKLLCQSTEGSSGDFWKGSILLVPRGDCTFLTKVMAGQALGAKAVIVYNTLASRYKSTNNDTVMVWPESKKDYDCDNSKSWILSSNLDLTNDQYNEEVNDPFLKNDECGSHAEQGIDHFRDRCQSQKCLLTGIASSGDGNFLEACCAWDLTAHMAGDDDDRHLVNIPSVYATMRTGDALKTLYRDSNLYLSLQKRSYPGFNLSSLILVAMATLLAWFAAYNTTSDYRQLRKTHRNIIAVTNTDPNQQPINGFHLRLATTSNSVTNNDGTTASSRRNEEDSVTAWSNATTVVHHNLASSGASIASSVTSAALPVEGSANVQMVTSENASTRIQPKNDKVPLILEPWHALGFVLLASGGLLILFYFKFYNVVKVFYATAAAGALTHVLIIPLIARIVPCRSMLQIPCFQTDNPRSYLNKFTILIVSSIFLSYLWTILWLWYGFTKPHAETHFFYYMTQNIMGACLCILFQSILRLNSIKVATILLIALFVYDIFFVFITPHVFGSSVMSDVATSGGPPDDVQYCQKYPQDRSECNGGMPLPILLILPRLGDYRGGLVLLGLGDVVFPGLLLSLGARLDATRAILQPSQYNSFNGYFLPLILSYAIGLLFANLMVYASGKAQPALLYLVPSTLGTIALIGHRGDELKPLWNGHPELAHADRLLTQDHESDRANIQTNGTANISAQQSVTSQPSVASQRSQHEPEQSQDLEGNEPTPLSEIREGSEMGEDDSDDDNEFHNEEKIRQNGPPYVL